MTVVSVSSHEVDAVAVFVPEGSLIRQSAVGDGDVVVMVVGGKRTSVVVGHGVTCRDNRRTYGSGHGRRLLLHHGRAPHTSGVSPDHRSHGDS